MKNTRLISGTQTHQLLATRTVAAVAEAAVLVALALMKIGVARFLD